MYQKKNTQQPKAGPFHIDPAGPSTSTEYCILAEPSTKRIRIDVNGTSAESNFLLEQRVSTGHAGSNVSVKVESPFTCNTCKIGFSSKWNINRHLRHSHNLQKSDSASTVFKCVMRATKASAINLT